MVNGVPAAANRVVPVAVAEEDRRVLLVEVVAEVPSRAVREVVGLVRHGGGEADAEIARLVLAGEGAGMTDLVPAARCGRDDVDGGRRHDVDQVAGVERSTRRSATFSIVPEIAGVKMVTRSVSVYALNSAAAFTTSDGPWLWKQTWSSDSDFALEEAVELPLRHRARLGESFTATVPPSGTVTVCESRTTLPPIDPSARTW